MSSVKHYYRVGKVGFRVSSLHFLSLFFFFYCVFVCVCWREVGGGGAPQRGREGLVWGRLHVEFLLLWIIDFAN